MGTYPNVGSGEKGASVPLVSLPGVCREAIYPEHVVYSIAKRLLDCQSLLLLPLA